MLICTAVVAACVAVAPPTAPEREFFDEPIQLTDAAQFVKAGEAYFSPDASWIIFQAVPVPPAGEEPSPHYSMYVAKLRYEGERVVGLGEPIMVSEPGSANTCGWFHPTLPGVILFGSTTVPPKADDAPGYSRDNSKYSWQFPREMEVVTRTVRTIVEDRVTDADERAELLARPDADEAVPMWTRDGYDAEASWSPDGRTVLYTAVDQATGDGDLWVYIPELDEHRPLIQAKGYDGGPFFSPNGRWICYRSDRKGDNLLQLFTARLEFDDDGLPTGASEHQLTDDGHVNWCPFWHPSGRFMLYATSAVGHFNYEVFAVPFEPYSTRRRARTRRITNADGFDGLPVFSPDGSLLMWTAQRGEDGSSQLVIARTTPDMARLFEPESGLAN